MPASSSARQPTRTQRPGLRRTWRCSRTARPIRTRSNTSAGWTTAEIPQQANGWKGANYSRWSNAEYDALYDQLTKELNPDKRAQIEVQLNDLVVNNDVAIPLVDRYASNGHIKALINTNYDPWDSALWNVAYWQMRPRAP